MKQLAITLLSVVLAVMCWSCNIDEELTDALPPNILLDNPAGTYTVKQGCELTVVPEYESAEGAVYQWIMGGEVLSTSPLLSFTSDKVGRFYILLTVTTDAGSDREEICVEVTALEIPNVSIIGNKEQTITLGSVLELMASVRTTSLITTVEWRIGEQLLSQESVCSFAASECGDYTITVTACNEDGTHSDTVRVTVVRPEDIPFEWAFARTEYHTVEGRTVVISPDETPSREDVSYTWLIDSEEVGTECGLIYTPTAKGTHRIVGKATFEQGGSEMTLERSFSLEVFAEDEFHRAANETSQADCNRVYEYTPAPGQFINELKTGGFDGTQTTSEAACRYAEKRINMGVWLSLGAFGGYIVVGFDHSINNADGYDLAVASNAFDGSSEPGVVWVMQDENGNTLPDDTWYELRGSETDVVTTIRDYAVTYWRPAAAGMPVVWTDNLGGKGEVDYLKTYHSQDYYYPLWIDSESYTLRGTRLEARNYDKSGNGSLWVQPHYDWGHADNFSPTDFVSTTKVNTFEISNAMDFAGKPVNLGHVDFVKVQCAVNSKSGWVGELSTEVSGVYDYRLK